MFDLAAVVLLAWLLGVIDACAERPDRKVRFQLCVVLEACLRLAVRHEPERVLRSVAKVRENGVLEGEVSDEDVAVCQNIQEIRGKNQI